MSFFFPFFASALQISTTLFSPFFVPRTLSKGKIRSRSRVVEQLVRARKRFIATTRRMASAQTFLIDKSIYVWREKLRENKEGGRVQVETLAGIALPRGLFRPCFAARAARDSCGPTDSPPTREREIRIYICKGRGRETNSAARPLHRETAAAHVPVYVPIKRDSLSRLASFFFPPPFFAPTTFLGNKRICKKGTRRGRERERVFSFFFEND